MSEREFLRTAQEAARLAGEVLDSWSSRFSISEKRPADLVTEADFASQEVIHRHIGQRFPDHNFLGEEGLNETNSPSPFRWVIDPLDGTSNYAHHFPYFAVSIGLECDSRLEVGVIHDPTRDEMFSAVRGKGATLNGKPIAPSRVKSLKDSMVVASLPVAVGANDPAIARFLSVLPHPQSLQRTGSAALNLAYVACGRLDAFWSSSLNPWDMAAGVLIVRESGGRVTKIDGSRFDLEQPDLLASNGSPLHHELQKVLTGAIGTG